MLRHVRMHMDNLEISFRSSIKQCMLNVLVRIASMGIHNIHFMIE